MNTITLKVGQMPGKLVSVEVSQGKTAREVFAIAGVEVSNHEVRLDGRVINIDTVIEGGNLLVAMKMIKGNANTIKVGQMPGKLVEVAYTQGMTAREIFELASVEVSNHEVRLDGVVTSIDSSINGGNLLVAMKMIKGNVEKYVTELSETEIENILGVGLPKEIDAYGVVEIGAGCLMVMDYILDEEMFDSVYQLGQEVIEVQDEARTKELLAEMLDIPTQVEHECKCNKGKEFVENKIAELQSGADTYWRMFREYDIQIKTLKEVLENM